MDFTRCQIFLKFSPKMSEISETAPKMSELFDMFFQNFLKFPTVVGVYAPSAGRVRRADAEAPTYRSLLGDVAWQRLDPAIRARFGDDCSKRSFYGLMGTVRLSPAGRVLAVLARLFGTSLCPRTGGDLVTMIDVEGDASSAKRLRAFVAAAADEIQASRGMARLVLLEFVRHANPDEPQPYLGRVHKPFVALIEEGQRQGEFRGDYDSAFLAQMAVGMLNSAITRWLADPEYPVERGLALAAEFVLNVFHTAPGSAEK